MPSMRPRADADATHPSPLTHPLYWPGHVPTRPRPVSGAEQVQWFVDALLWFFTEGFPVKSLSRFPPHSQHAGAHRDLLWQARARAATPLWRLVCAEGLCACVSLRCIVCSLALTRVSIVFRAGCVNTFPLTVSVLQRV